MKAFLESSSFLLPLGALFLLNTILLFRCIVFDAFSFPSFFLAGNEVLTSLRKFSNSKFFHLTDGTIG